MTRCIVGRSSMADIPGEEWERIFGRKEENEVYFINSPGLSSMIPWPDKKKRKKHKKATVETIAQRTCREIVEKFHD